MEGSYLFATQVPDTFLPPSSWISPEPLLSLSEAVLHTAACGLPMCAVAGLKSWTVAYAKERRYCQCYHRIMAWYAKRNYVDRPMGRIRSCLNFAQKFRLLNSEDGIWEACSCDSPVLGDDRCFRRQTKMRMMMRLMTRTTQRQATMMTTTNGTSSTDTKTKEFITHRYGGRDEFRVN